MEVTCILLSSNKKTKLSGEASIPLAIYVEVSPVYQMGRSSCHGNKTVF